MTRFLRIAEVVSKTGVSRSTIYELMGKGGFPMARRLTSRTVGWDDAEVEGWMASRETAPIRFGAHRGKQIIRQTGGTDSGRKA